MSLALIHPYKSQKNLTRILGGALCVVTILYIYFALATAYYVVEWDAMEQKTEERMVAVSELEYEYSILQNTITEVRARTLGFEEAGIATYTLRKRLVSN